MKALHTPLPWWLSDDETSILAFDKEDPEVVAETEVSDIMGIALPQAAVNAKLIVAAVNNVMPLADAVRKALHHARNTNAKGLVREFEAVLADWENWLGGDK